MGTDVTGSAQGAAPRQWPGPAPVGPPPGPPTAPAVADADSRGALVRGGVGLVLVGLGWGTRALGHWDEGRWWVLEAVLVVVGGLLGLTGVVGSVGALGRITRSKLAMTGTAPGAVALAVSGLALTGAGVVGGVDWQRLDVPAAWERLRPEDDRRTDLFGRTAAATPDPRPGACLSGEGPEGLGDQVACLVAHRLEVLELVDHPEGTERPTGAGLEGALRDDCAAGAEEGGLAPDLVARVAVRAAPVEEWAAGDRWTLCVLAWDEPVEGQQAP